MRRILFAVALVLGAALWAAVLTATAREAARATVPDSLPDLDELEARMLRATEITRRWEYLAERHREAAPVVCEHLADAASRKYVP